MSQDAEIQNYQANREAIMKNWQPEVKSDEVESPPLPAQESVAYKAQFLSEFTDKSDKKLV